MIIKQDNLIFVVSRMRNELGAIRMALQTDRGASIDTEPVGRVITILEVALVELQGAISAPGLGKEVDLPIYESTTKVPVPVTKGEC